MSTTRRNHTRGSKIVPLPVNLSGKERRRLQENPAGRTCPHCGTILTRWNPGPNCFRHDSTPYPANIVMPYGPERR